MRRSLVGSTPTLFRHSNRGPHERLPELPRPAERHRQRRERRRAGAREGGRGARRRAPRRARLRLAPAQPDANHRRRGARTARRPRRAAAGRAAFLAAVGWTGAAEAERAVAERFAPVAAAVRAAARDEPADPAAALADFEAWYAAERGVPFLALMEREIVELPLVEILSPRPGR